MAEAVERATAVADAGRVRVVAGEHLHSSLRDALPELDEESFLVEPRPRGTGPALAWAAHRIARREPEAVMVSLHADHRITPTDRFRETMQRGVRAAREGGRLFCVGIRPARPETGYGYVRLAASLGEGVFEVAEFVEKPDLRRARRYLESGEYLWNSGLFVWRVADFLAVARNRSPELRDALERLDAEDERRFFDLVPPISVDVAVMERAPSVGAVEASFEWDDVGVWNALARTLGDDAEGNTAVGEVRTLEAAGNIAWAEDGRITLFGVEGLVVVKSGDELLVTTRDSSHHIKRLIKHFETTAAGEVVAGAEPETP